MARSTFGRIGVLSFGLLSACALFQRDNGNDPPTDANLAAMFLAANNTDVSYAQVAVAPGRTSNAAVLGFANRMLADHNGLNKSALEVFDAANLHPADNVASLNFRDESAAHRDTLRELTGARFDSAYIANEVRYHTRLLVVLDSVMIPAARKPQLKAMLTSVRPAVAAHLEHAERIQADLKK
jgi:putative membrane protein